MFSYAVESTGATTASLNQIEFISKRQFIQTQIKYNLHGLWFIYVEVIDVIHRSKSRDRVTVAAPVVNPLAWVIVTQIKSMI